MMKNKVKVLKKKDSTIFEIQKFLKKLISCVKLLKQLCLINKNISTFAFVKYYTETNFQNT